MGLRLEMRCAQLLGTLSRSKFRDSTQGPDRALLARSRNLAASPALRPIAAQAMRQASRFTPGGRLKIALQDLGNIGSRTVLGSDRAIAAVSI